MIDDAGYQYQGRIGRHNTYFITFNASHFQRARQGLEQEGLRPRHRPRDGRDHHRAPRLAGPPKEDARGASGGRERECQQPGT